MRFMMQQWVGSSVGKSRQHLRGSFWSRWGWVLIAANYTPAMATPEPWMAQVPANPVPPPTLPPTGPNADPNRDRFLQPVPTPLPLPDGNPTPITPPSPPTSPPPATGSLEVRQIDVIGSTLLTPQEIDRLTRPYEGRSVTLEELRTLADQITQQYLNRGYITSRALLVDQEVTNGVVQIRVIEGSLEAIEIEGLQRLRPSYVRSRIQLGAKSPLNTAELEDQLRLLRIDPLFSSVEASLRAGSGLGQSRLIVRVEEASPWDGAVSVDNFSPPSVGSERLGLQLSHRNVTGRGDEFALSYYHTTTGGADVWDFNYRVPINPMNGTIQLRYAPSGNRVTQEPFSLFDIGGDSQLYEISYRQPIIRSPREEFALSFGFSHQRGQTFLFNEPFRFAFGPDENGYSRTSVFKFGQDYVRRDPKGAWALRSLFSFGTGIFGATVNEDPIPDGQFVSWLGQIQRVQILNENNVLIIQADLQLTQDPLLSSQQFVIGGGQSVRGYRQNLRSGDNGFRLSIEDRITLNRDASGLAIFQLAPFLEMGSVWNQSRNPNTLNGENFLASMGLGIIWQPTPKFNIRLDYGRALVSIGDKGNNAQDEGFHFSLNYRL